jgi:nitroreductase
MEHSTIELVNARFSCRIYLEQPIDESLRDALADHLRSASAGLFGSPVRLVLAAAAADDPKNLKGLGTYGFVKGATGFLLGAVGQGPRNLEDYGFVVEQAILRATDLGLGTCWLGGSFTKSTFAKRLGGLRSGEIMPAVVSLGYPGEDGSRRIKQREQGERRLSTSSLFFADQFGKPLPPSESDPFTQILEGVRMAPSASNKQPWRVVRCGKDWHFYLERTKGYGKGSALYTALRLADLQRVDMGIAMSHFALLANEAGFSGSWVLDEPDVGVLGRGVEYTATWRPIE